MTVRALESEGGNQEAGDVVVLQDVFKDLQRVDGAQFGSVGQEFVIK